MRIALMIVVVTGATFAQVGGQAPAIPNLSQRPPGSSLGKIRVGAADNTLWFGWRVAIPSGEFKQLTLSEALAKADTLAVTGVQASNSQKLSPEIPKPVDYRLQTGERAALLRRLKELNEQIIVYRIDRLDPDPAIRRKTFEFAKGLNASLIVTTVDAGSLADIDKLAGDVGIDVAVDSTEPPKAAMAALSGHSKRLGLAIDTGRWQQQGLKIVDGFEAVREKLMAIDVRSPQGTSELFLSAFRAGLKPLYITVHAAPSADPYASFEKALSGFENAMLPAMAARVRQMVDSPPGKIRGGDRLSADMRQQIDSAAPRQPIVQPKKKHKMLVTDLQMYSGHSTIPHGNYLLELMGKYTGAFEPIFSNDLDLLKYPKIKEFDAVFLNNVCGMIHNDPEVREGILRFVREGGGIGGNHAVTFANNHWPEFAEMMGGWAGAHHTEKQVVKIDDPGSPLTKSFGKESFEHVDEFYQFPSSSPYSREKQHILLSIDVEKSDRATAGRFCPECTRPDQDYGLAWIRTYGKGRTYFTPLGHTVDMYTKPMWTQHLLAAIQYILGDLDADATPSAKLASRK